VPPIALGDSLVLIVVAFSRVIACMQMLYEPIQYVITGKRICDEDICEYMEKIGKEESLYRMWKGSMPYLQSIANKVTPFLLLMPPALCSQTLTQGPLCTSASITGTQRHCRRCPRQPAKALSGATTTMMMVMTMVPFCRVRSCLGPLFSSHLLHPLQSCP
jgi:hypothetical protein